MRTFPLTRVLKITCSHRCDNGGLEMRVFVALLVAANGVAMAQEADTGWYAGFGIGSMLHTEAISPDSSLVDTASATKLFGGFRWGSRWGVEVAYVDSSSTEGSAAGLDLLADQFSTVYSTEIASLTIRPMAYLPVAWGTLFGGIGVFDGDRRSERVASTSLAAEALPLRFSESSSGATLLLGTEWPIGPLQLRAEYEWWDLDRADNASLGLGLSFRF